MGVCCLVRATSFSSSTQGEWGRRAGACGLPGQAGVLAEVNSGVPGVAAVGEWWGLRRIPSLPPSDAGNMSLFTLVNTW